MTRRLQMCVSLVAVLSAVCVDPAMGLPGKSIGSLRELARNSPTGEAVVFVEPDSEETYIDLHELAAFSDAVIIGVAVANQCSLSPDEKTIFTDYVFQVEDVLLGPFRRGDKVTVRMPWGRVEFPDGTAVEFEAGWFRVPVEGRSYALLLQRRGARLVMSPTGGPQGVFELGVDGKITVSSGRKDDPVWTYIDMPTENFLELLRWAVRDAKQGQ